MTGRVDDPARMHRIQVHGSLIGASFVGYARVPGTGATFHAVDPAAGQALPTVFRSVDAGVVDRAALLAAQAFPDFARRPVRARGDLLRAVAAAIEAHSTSLASLAASETGLAVPRLEGEIGRTCHQLRFYASSLESGLGLDARIDHGDPARSPLPRPDLRSIMRPIGPVAVFGSSNFPFAYSVAGGDTASAWIAGCPVIVKAHPAHPGTSERTATLVVEAAQRAGMPEGVFSMLFDAGYDVGAALVRHPAIKAVGFTGSQRGGRALMDLAASRPEPIPVFAEMGSVNPVFILPGALAARGREIARGLHASFTLGVGQFCTNPGLHILPGGSAAESFLSELGERTAATCSGPMLTRAICESFRRGVERLRLRPGVREIARANAAGPLHGAAVLLAVDGASFLQAPELHEEVFGPSTLAVLCTNEAQMLAVARSLPGQLTMSVHGTDDDFARARDLLDAIESRAGRIVFNGFPTGVEVCHAIVHGGPYPATSDSRTTSVGSRAVLRFMRPVCFQNAPESLLPPELRDSNPGGVPRLVDGRLET